jgi:hypothetical protein
MKGEEMYQEKLYSNPPKVGELQKRAVRFTPATITEEYRLPRSLSKLEKMPDG